MSGGGWVDCQGPRITNIGDVIEQVQGINEGRACCFAAFDMEPDQATISAFQIGLGPFQILAILVIGINHAVDKRMFVQEINDSGGIAGIPECGLAGFPALG